MVVMEMPPPAPAAPAPAAPAPDAAPAPAPAAAAACAAVANVVCVIVATAALTPWKAAVTLICTVPAVAGEYPAAVARPAALVVTLSVEPLPPNVAPLPGTANVTVAPGTGRLLASRTSTIGATA